MADDHNEDPPNEVHAAVANVDHAEIERSELELQEYYRELLQESDIDALAPKVAALENEDYHQQMQEYADRIFQQTRQPQQVAAPEQQLEQGSSSGINPPYQQQAVQEFGQFLEREVAALAQLEQGSSSGINPFYPQEFAQLQEHVQEAIATQGMPQQEEELTVMAAQGMPQQEEELTVMAAQGMPQQPQQVEHGGHAPPDVPASLQNKIGLCSEPFEKQLTENDLRRTKLWMLQRHVDSRILPLLEEADDFLEQGIQVTVYDNEGDEYPMQFQRCPRGYYNLNGEQWPCFRVRCGLKRRDSLTFLAFLNAESGRLCFFIKVRR